MNWKESDFKANVTKIKAILVYGQDAGRVSEYVSNAIKIWGVEKDSLLTVSAKDFTDRQDAIYADACSMSMFGGEKAVVITDAGDSDAKNIADLLGQSSLSARVIVTGGELKKGGGLRNLFETDNTIAAIACYRDNSNDLMGFIRKELFDNLKIAEVKPDAMAYMVANMGMDRGISRGFLQKIALYVDDTKIVTLADAECCLPDTGFSDIDEFMVSLAAGNYRACMIALDRLFYGDAAVAMLIRRLMFYFNNILSAVRDRKMPRFFNDRKRAEFNNIIRIWPESEIIAVLNRLNELEKQTRTGLNEEILFRDFALKLSLRAAKLGQSKRK